MDSDTLWMYASPALLVIAYALAAQFAVAVVAYSLDKLSGALASARDKINATKLGALAKADDYLFGLLIPAVAATKDTLVDKLKAASSDNKLTEAEAADCINAAYSTFKSSLSSAQLAHLMELFGEDFENIVKARIPGVVTALKKQDQQNPNDQQFVQ